MKQLFRLSILLLALLLPATATAYDFEVDGIYYNIINENEAAVAPKEYYEYPIGDGNYGYEAYSDYSGEVTIPESVTYNGNTYPITSIDNYAFYYCYGLSSINIPYSITTIGKCAFSGCTGLTVINIPKSVTSLSDYAFSGCSSVTIINVDNDNCYYDSRNNCNAIIETASNTLIMGCMTTVIPNTVTTIANSAFFDCSGLTNVNIPNSVTFIGERAFYGCSGLTSITIPNSVTSIGNAVFESCSGLTSVTISTSITSIGNYAFYGCSGLTSVNMPTSVTSIGTSAFYDCYRLTSVNISDISSWCNISFANQESNPLSYAGHLYLNGTEITNLIIPNSVTSIGNNAFCGSLGLTSVTIPNSVTTIGNSAFRGCSGLTSIGIPTSVTSIGSYAFYSCSGLTGVTIPSAVTFIGQSAFRECKSLNAINYNAVSCADFTSRATTPFAGENIWRINIGDSVQYVPAYLISAQFLEITIGKSVTSIADKAFYCDMVPYLKWNARNCSSMGGISASTILDVTIGPEVEVIPNGFIENSHISSVTIPNSVRKIGHHAFANCGELTNVSIGNSVTEIGISAFDGCPRLKRVDITDIAAWCGISFGNSSANPLFNAQHLFLNNNEISNLDIPNSVSSIGNYAFCGGTGLISLTIPNSVTTIGDYAFSDCSGLTGELTIPNSVTTIGNSAFSGCSGITGELTIPILVTSIGNSAFSGCSGITGELTIPILVTSIGNSTFSGCSGLTSMTMGNSVTSIGDYAFHNCTGLIDDLALPNSVISIGNYAFYGCSGLMGDLTIPNSVTNIGDCAFYGCSGLMGELTIPNSVTTIGSYAFDGCTGITQLTWNAVNCSYNGNLPTSNIVQVTIGDQVRVLPNNFASGSKITEISIPNTVTYIGSSAFFGCSGLTGELIIPNSVTTIGSYAFYGCSGLPGITIGSSVTEIGNSAFSGCSGLTGELIIPNSVSSIGNLAFSDCSALTSLIIPSSVTSIGNSAFSGCIEIDMLNYNATNCADFTTYYSYHPFKNLNISTINIGDNVQRIPAYFAYGLQKLSSVTIPSSVTSVGTQAFYNCPIIESVTCLPTPPPSTPSTGDMALFNTNVYIHSPLYVPMGTEKSYMYDQAWGQFINVIGIKTQDDVLATDITLNQSVMSMILGTSSQLVATVLPDSTTNKMVSWASSNPNVATVDENGVVTAMGLGNAMITAITTDGSNLSATCRVIVTSMSTTNGFAVADAEVMHGKEIVIPVAMNNDQTILAFQTDIYLPEGFGIAMDEDDEYMISPSSRLTDDHIFMANENNGTVSVVCYTPEGRPIGGNSGDDLFYITVQVPEDASGDYAIYLRNSRLTMADYTELRVPDVGAVVTVKSFIPGDANDSRTVTVTDIVVTAQYVLQMNPEPFVFEAADMNGDGDVTVTDIMLIAYLINHPTMNAPQRMPALEGGYDSMSGEDVTLMAGETRKVSVVLNNEMDYTAFQLDLTLPAGLTASNFQLTDRAGNHASDVNTLTNGKTRVLCYSPAIEAIEGHEGALLTFDVTANCEIEGSIIVDGIELVTVACQTVLMNSFTIGVNSTTSVNELNGAKTVAGVDYFNLAGQQIDRPGSGVTLVVTTYTDGTRSTTKVIK